MDRLETMRAFVTVATEGSFNGAANKLDTSNQLVSKYVSQLENHLGVRLFNRTTRRVNLTEEGEQCFHLASAILENVGAMEGYFGQLNTEVQGILKINAPLSFSTLHLSSLVHDFKQQHPSVGFNLQLNDRLVDVVEDGFDLALRIGRLKSSSLIAKKLAPIRLVLCASPYYLKKFGTPDTPSALNPEHFLRYSYLDHNQFNAPLAEALKLKNNKQPYGFMANNGEILRDMAIAGEGFILQPTFIVGKAIKEGKLKVILKEYEPDAMALYIVYPHRKLLAPKLRAFIDFTGNYYGETPYWDNF